MRATSIAAAVLLLLAAGAWGCGSKAERPHADSDSDVDSDVDTDVDSDTDTDIPPVALSITRVEPTHGPTVGENQVEVRGNGFGGPFTIDLISVWITDSLGDQRRVDPLDIEIVSPQLVRVLAGPRHRGMPAGAVGPATFEVRIAEPGSTSECVANRNDCREVANLPGGPPFGYTYDAFYVDPPRGTVGGGTKIGIYGTETIWDANAVVKFGAAEAECTVLGATRIDCRTPPGDPGDVDVGVEDGSGEGHYEDVLEDGFEYYNSADPVGGGLGGGPIDGLVNVTVLNAQSLLPVVEAFVMLGVDGGTDYQGYTNALGQIAFHGDDLSGRQEVTAAKEGFQSTSFVEFDARDVTIFLVPIPDPNPGTPPPGRFAATIDGTLVFDGPNEFGPNPWVIIPDPVDPDEEKVCYVATTQFSIFYENISPGPARRVTELDPLRPGVRDYHYQITARPAAMAVWAICGLENARTLAFLPYAMGVRRNVLAGPAQLVEGADIKVDIPLDHLNVVQLEDTPLERASGPDHYRADAYIDLGGEGVIARDDKSIYSVDPGIDFRFIAQPPLMGTIADAQWLFVGGAYSGEEDVNPFSVVLEQGVIDTREPVVIDEFLGVPYLVDPAYGGTVVDDTFTWDAPGADPTFNLLLIETLDGAPVWQVFVRGEERSFTLPDLEAIVGLPPPPDGYLVLIAWAIRVPDLSYDELSYSYLSNSYWEAYAADAFLFQYP